LVAFYYSKYHTVQSKPFTMASLFKVAFVTFGLMSGANAWGALGHATVAYVAQNYVSADTATW